MARSSRGTLSAIAVFLVQLLDNVFAAAPHFLNAGSLAEVLLVKSVKLIQLGDVHFPDNRNRVIGDVKDTGLHGSLVAAVLPNVLRSIMREIADVRRTHLISGLLVCGDLTSKGDLGQYIQCVEYLRDALDLSTPGTWATDGIHAVPGNHDVDRALCDPNDIFVKFDSLSQPWTNIGLPILTTRDVRTTTLTHDGCSVNISSINSCIGCGERRYLPAPIRHDLHTILTRYAVAVPATAFELLGDQLDTPAFLDTHIQDVATRIAGASPDTVSLVLAHHNVLPQTIPRLAIYTELINGGLFRSRLTACKKPVVYCHGHIHDDPIESVLNLRQGDSPFVSISAPEAVNGFNLIDFQFSRSRQPLGCAITCYRMHPHGGVTPSDSVRVPLVGPTDAYRRLDDDMREVIAAVPREPIRFNALRDVVNAGRDAQMQRPTLRDILIEAEWLALVALADRDDQPEYWSIRRRDQ